MEQAVGVLCTRVRVEEKGIIAALAAAGIPAIPFPPTDLRLSLAPEPRGGGEPPRAVPGPAGTALPVVLDRCPNRVVAAAILPIWRGLGVPVLDAGLAATGTRAAVAGALAASGLPRPETRLVFGEEAALAAAHELGIPLTLLPMTPGDRGVALWDDDTAEAVLEHRATLGSTHDGVALLQAGTPGLADRTVVLVLDGVPVAAHGQSVPGPEARHLAAMAAAVLGASIVGVELVLGPAGPVVWDIHPVPELRQMTPFGTGDRDLAGLVAARLVERWPSRPDHAVVTPPAVVELGVASIGVADRGDLSLVGTMEMTEGVEDGIPLAI